MVRNHVGIAISNYEKSKQFYSRVLAPLGITGINSPPSSKNT